MNNKFAEYVETLNDKQRLEIISGYEELEETGVIGDAPVRRHAKIIAERLRMENAIVVAMRDLAFETYRYFAKQYLKFNVDQNSTPDFGSFEPFEVTAGFELLSPEIQGIWVDGEYKSAMWREHHDFIPAEQGLDYDGMMRGAYCDVKFLRSIKPGNYRVSASVYISQNEYRFGRQHDTVYEIVYLKDSLIQHLTSFTFSEAKEAGAITVFDKGRKVLDRETGKEAMPWSIDILTVRPELEELLTTLIEND